MSRLINDYSFVYSSNKDIMNGNKPRILELLWRVFIVCFLPKHLSPIEKLNHEISILTKNLSKFTCSIEENLIRTDIIPLQKQYIEFTPIVHLLIKWVQLICAHYKFWLYDLQESFADGRAFLYIISYYLPSLCDYKHDIKHLTTLATCQTREEHIQFNLELGQPQLNNIYERNVKSNFRLLEECIKQFGTFSNEFVKYESYAKDVPDERCTIIILAMLAYDLLFANDNKDNSYRRQNIFQELKEKYLQDDGSINEIEKDERNNDISLDHQKIETTLENSMNSADSDISVSVEIAFEAQLASKLSISSTTIIYPTKNTYPIPIIQSVFGSSLFEKEDKANITPISLESISQSVLDTMNHDILNRVELLAELDSNDDEDNTEDSFNSARSSSTTDINQRRVSLAASISLNDFVELEKTIENEQHKNQIDNTSLFLTDETVSSEMDSVELNQFDEVNDVKERIYNSFKYFS